MLQPGAGTPIETGLSMAMGAAGGRGEIVASGDGFGLAFKADALWVGTRTDAASGPAGNLDSTAAAVTRLRMAIEGSQSTTLAGRLVLKPSLDCGVCQDGGAAETGAGTDLGAGLVLADAVTGLAVDVRVRRLLVHQAVGFAASGTSVSVSYDLMPSTPLGFTACVSTGCGSAAMSGAQALWGQENHRRRGNSPTISCSSTAAAIGPATLSRAAPDARPRSPLTRLHRSRPDCSANQMIELPWRWSAGDSI